MSLKTCSVSVLLIVATMVVFFQDLVSVDVEISQVKRFDTFMNFIGTIRVNTFRP